MQDPLFSNKIAGAALACLLLFFGIPILVNKFTGAGHHGAGHGADHHPAEDNPLELAYPIAFSFGPVAVAAQAPEPDLGTLLAEADPERGKKKIAKCTSCHTLEAGAGNLQGPNLYDVIDRPVGGIAGFAYSATVKEAGGVWSYDRLDSYIENSQKYLPGTAMVQKIRKPKERADILAYLSTLSQSPVAFPPPMAPEEPVLEEEPALQGEPPSGESLPLDQLPVDQPPVDNAPQAPEGGVTEDGAAEPASNSDEATQEAAQ